MEMNGYKKRTVDRKLLKYLESFGAVLIEGPKWCGKTWTGRNSAESVFMVADPKGNFNNRRMALMDPDMILSGNTPRLIDEWQEVPTIWDAVRGEVDDRAKTGQFILTGSATINKEKYIHTGTGRIAHLRMRPMSLFESGQSDGSVSLEDICLGRAKNQMTGEVKLEKIIEYILSGGWPANTRLSFDQARLIPEEYVYSVLHEDIFKVDNIKRDGHKVELLLRSLSRNEAMTVSNAALKRDITNTDMSDVNIDTITDYLNLFRHLFLIEDIPPFSPDFRSSLRIKQNEKRHFTDPSLPCAFLSMTKTKLLEDLNFLGFLFESLVERDLLTYVDDFHGKLFHYQDNKGNEMDALIELQDGNWCGVEIRLGANQIEEASKNLLKVNDDIKKAGGKPAGSLMVICGLSNAAYLRQDGVYVVPITSLRS